MIPDSREYDTIRYNASAARVLDKLVRHVVCLHWVDVRSEPQGFGNKQSDYDPAAFAISAFVIAVRDMWFLITAGHILHDIQERLANGRTIMKSRLLADFTPNPATSGIPFPLEDSLQWHIDSDGVDYGVIPLRPGFVRPLVADGTLALTETCWNSCPNEVDEHFLLGFPSQANTLTIASSGHTRTVDISVACPLLPVFPVSDPPAALRSSYARFYAEVPIANGMTGVSQAPLTDIDGMSGGPIFGMKWTDANNIRYWVIAVQSAWLKSKRILAACPILPLVNAIEKGIDQHLGSSEGDSRDE